MTQHFDLRTTLPVDSMHDQVITGITSADDKLELHFNELSFSFMADYAPARSYFESHREFHSCDVVFSEPDSPYAAIYQEKQSAFRGRFLSMRELTAFIDAHDYRIEISNLLCGYELIVFQGTFINRQGHYCDNCIRLLAKLSKTVKIADTSNQGKAESKTFSAISIAFREDTKPFDEADGVFNKDAFLCNFTVFFMFLLGQRMVLGTFFRQQRVGMHLSKPLISSICFQHGSCFGVDTGILE